MREKWTKVITREMRTGKYLLQDPGNESQELTKQQYSDLQQKFKLIVHNEGTSLSQDRDESKTKTENTTTCLSDTDIYLRYSEYRLRRLGDSV